MSKLNYFLEEYSKSHQHPINLVIHHICVPLITLNIMVYYRLLPLFGVPWPEVVSVLVLFYYGFLDKKLILPMLIPLIILCIASYFLVLKIENILILNSLIFALAWFAQFIGHSIEGKKPSFVEDLRFLFIGPIWVLKKWKLL